MAGMSKDFNKFMTKFQQKKNEHGKYDKIITHTTTKPRPGSYHIPADKLNKLYKMILMEPSLPFIIERIPDTNAPKKLFLDFDFKQKLGESRIITVEDIDDLISAIFIELYKLFGIENARVIVQQRKSGYEIDTIFKDGLHVIIPNILLPIAHQFILREHLINNYGKTLWEGRFINSYEDIVDKVVIKDNGWYLQYCGKYGIGAYETILDETLVYIDDDNCQRLENPKTEGIELIMLCSYSHNEGAIIYNIKEEFLPKESLQTTKGQKPETTKGQKPKTTRTIAITSPPVIDEILKLQLEEATVVLNSLAPFRRGEYKDWIQVAFCCKNIGISTETFIDWSKSKDVYKDSEIYERLNASEKGFNINTLFQWLKKDDYKAWAKLSNKRTDIARILDIFNAGDLAKLYFNCNPFIYNFCTDVGWFRYNEHGFIISSKGYPVCLHNSIEAFLKKIIKKEGDKLIRDSPDYKQKYAANIKIYKEAGTSRFLKDTMHFLAKYYNCDNILDKIDSNPNILAFQNMIYDLSIKAFRPIDLSKDYISKNCGYSINPKSCPSIRKELHDVLISIHNTEEMVKYWLEITAKAFFGVVSEQKFYILTGGGGNGKGLLIKCISAMLGSYYCPLEQTFFQTNFKADRANSTLAQSKGCRFLSVSEPSEDVPLNIGLIKLLSGEDEIRTRDLNCSAKTFINHGTFFMLCNTMPPLEKVDGGIVRRARVIEHKTQFVDVVVHESQQLKDPVLGMKLTKPEYINEFMLYIIEVASAMDMSKPVIAPKEVLERTETYLAENDPIKLWLHEYYNITGNYDDKIKATELRDDYNSKTEVKLQVNAKKFKDKMTSEGIKQRPLNGYSCYWGLCRKPEEKEEEKKAVSSKSESPCLI